MGSWHLTSTAPVHCNRKQCLCYSSRTWTFQNLFLPSSLVLCPSLWLKWYLFHLPSVVAYTQFWYVFLCCYLSNKLNHSLSARHCHPSQNTSPELQTHILFWIYQLHVVGKVIFQILSFLLKSFFWLFYECIWCFIISKQYRNQFYQWLLHLPS